MSIVIEPLGKQHNRSGFSCGEPELDDWFRRRAGQDDKRDIARVFVAVDREIGVIGFYSLNAFTLSIPDLPEEIARKLPRYGAVPSALIGRLARDERAQGRGIGALLLAEAIRRVLGAAKSLAVFTIVVDAKNARAVAFYKSFGFRALPSTPNRLFLPVATALAALRSA